MGIRKSRYVCRRKWNDDLIPNAVESMPTGAHTNTAVDMTIKKASVGCPSALHYMLHMEKNSLTPTALK